MQYGASILPIVVSLRDAVYSLKNQTNMLIVSIASKLEEFEVKREDLLVFDQTSCS